MAERYAGLAVISRDTKLENGDDATLVSGPTPKEKQGTVSS